jgi:hypothetical protein
VILSVTLAGWIFAVVAGGLALWIVLRLVWMFCTNEELVSGGSFGTQLTSGSGRFRRLFRRARSH